MTWFCLGHHIQVQPTLLKGETMKGAAKRSDKAVFLLPLLLIPPLWGLKNQRLYCTIYIR